MVKLPDGNYVNPQYVTCIEMRESSTSRWTVLWVVGAAGYGTLSFRFDGDRRDSLAKLLGDQEESK